MHSFAKEDTPDHGGDIRWKRHPALDAVLTWSKESCRETICQEGWKKTWINIFGFL